MRNPHEEIFDRLKIRSRALALSDAAERATKISRLYGAVYHLRAEIAAAGHAEVGADGRGQLLALKPSIANAIANVERWMRPSEVEPDETMMGRRAYVHYEPKGVVLHLSTWNAPILISLVPVISMIAAGNAVVLKPSELAPRAAELVVKIIQIAGLSEDVAVVTGGPAVATALLKLPFNHICYVGNNRIGRIVMEAAAQHFAGVTLEMGGKNPIIVADDADLDDAAAKIVFGRHILTGQACLCPDYILVDKHNKQALAEKLIEKINAFYNSDGRGFEASAALGRIINERHMIRIGTLLSDAVDKGAKILVGGGMDPSSRFVSPTVLDGVTEDMAIFHEEIFGPILTVHGVASRQEMLDEIEKRPAPLGLYVFTRSRETADWFISRTRAGSTAVNNIALQATIPTLPFGGVNHSGIGRLNGEAGFREFSNPRGVVEDALDPKLGAPMFYPPYPPGVENMFDQMLLPDPAWPS